MQAVQLETLVTSAPEGVDAAMEVVTGFDRALVLGLARLSEDAAAAVLGLAGAVSGTPLGVLALEAAEKVVAGSITDDHLLALAGARSAVLGAVHDALLAHLDTTLTRTRTPWPPTTGTAHAAATQPDATHPGGPLASGAQAGVAQPGGVHSGGAQADGAHYGTAQAGGAQVGGSGQGGHAGAGGAGRHAGAGGAGAGGASGGRAWLRELGIAGWRGVDHDLVSAADQAIEGLLRDPAQRRLAVLLDGLAAELRACSPVATMEDIPARRWADLWARAVLLSHATPQPADPETVSGRLLILGVDLHEHATAVQAQVHAVLEPQGRLVRASVTAAKVDTITDQAVWGLFSDHPVLMGALAKNLTLDVTDLPLVGGDLLWDEAKAKVGELANPFTTARVQLAEAATAAITPLDRHPVMIGEPVLVEGYTVKDGAIHLGGHALAVEGDLPRSTACIGLLRWDAGQWSLRPLAVQTKSKTTHNGDNALNPGKSDAVGVLRERAGRLLRK